MGNRASKLTVLKRLPLLCLCGLRAAGCGAANLGDIDETQSERDEMPGPGVFTGEDGVASLKWGGKRAAAEQGADVADSGAALAAAEPNTEMADEGAVTAAPAPRDMDEKAEFEAFKQWQRLRAAGTESEEYREFLLWLEFRQFKATGE